ncbi:hypothetical protein QQS21_005486 [Conoideocrella luteorostrata]|uniref:Uncharacterized protein n=1 Tax=Conoideocrella luteorostrata TaxID=1105319 RepID=A0AAJ0CRT4_9HYPO|nr:hypothetical protein QQS21_005486 [Conoideocrella luteorostrata]
MALRLPCMGSSNRPIVLFLGFLLFSCTLPIQSHVRAEQDPSLVRIRHGPVLPNPTGSLSNIHRVQVEEDQDAQADNPDQDLRRRTQKLGAGGMKPRANQPQEPLQNPSDLAEQDKTSTQKRDQPPPTVPEYTPVVTPPPNQDAALASMGYKQLTYYTCNTVGGNEHCGWHVPIVKAQGVKRDSGTVWIVVVSLAGVFALALM